MVFIENNEIVITYKKSLSIKDKIYITIAIINKKQPLKLCKSNQ